MAARKEKKTTYDFETVKTVVKTLTWNSLVKIAFENTRFINVILYEMSGKVQEAL